MDFNLLELIARAGGGGSSSSSGGSGGDFIGLIGYAAGHYPAAFVKKRFKHTIPAIAAGGVGTVAATGLFVAGRLYFTAVIIFIAGCIGAYGGATGLLGKFAKRSKEAQARLQKAAASDPMWNEDTIKKTASDTFVRFQYDWANFNGQGMAQYLAPRYLAHVQLMLYALAQMGRRNVLWPYKITAMELIDVSDKDNNTEDRMTVAIAASGTDKLVDTTTNTDLATDNSDFAEVWQFVRHERTWLLESITPSTTSDIGRNSTLEQFAAANSMYYSPDWGRLLLPRRGRIFSTVAMSVADVNDHVIGYWQGNLLVQMYSYSPGQGKPYYMVGQLTLPKTYTGIMILRKDDFGSKLGNIFNSAPSGYQKMSYEWVDFNRNYVVYAAEPDRVASFELLNPGFMAYLYDQKLKIDIEVVDNVVYLYSSNSARTMAEYGGMLEVLKRAYKELKL